MYHFYPYFMNDKMEFQVPPNLELLNWHLEFSSLTLLYMFLTDYTESIFVTFHLEKKNSFSFFFFVSQIFTLSCSITSMPGKGFLN